MKLKMPMKTNIKHSILIVDDQAAMLHSLCATLSRFGYDLLVANSGQQAINILNGSHPDLILMDNMMPDMSGIEVCRAIKESPDLNDIPIIFLTASDDAVDDAFSAGAVDYIHKPFRESELVSRVSTHLNISLLRHSLEEANFVLKSLNINLEERVKQRTRDLVETNAALRNEINERRHLQDKLDYLSKYDFVTRLFNRVSLEEFLEANIITINSAEVDKSFYFLFLDVDQFKIINDTCGHSAGDELLRQISDCLKKMEDDYQLVAARMGGDEFGMAYYAKNDEHAFEIAKVVHDTISGLKFNWHDSIYSIAISMGLVEVQKNIGNAKSVISIAERTCYEAKTKGGGEIAYYNLSRDYIDKNERQMRWVPILQKAQDDDRLSLHFQHIVDATTGQKCKAEILIRLIGEDGNLVYPDAFIPVAERYHLIANIDRWVIERALTLKKELGDTTQLSINISGETFNRKGFADDVERIIKQSGITPEQICFEITETSALSNIESTRSFIERLHQVGCEFSLDDFGTGTSTFSYLKQLPVDYLKVDRMFIDGIETEKVNRMMVESITSICKEMNVKVIAEGVETQSQLAVLNEIGVDYIQGYFYHRPTAYTLESLNLTA